MPYYLKSTILFIGKTGLKQNSAARAATSGRPRKKEGRKANALRDFDDGEERRGEFVAHSLPNVQVVSNPYFPIIFLRI